LRTFRPILLGFIAMGVLAPLAPSQAQLLATLDSYRIRDESEVFAELSERLENLLKELQEELAARQEFEYLPPEEAQQAAALRLKQIRGTMTQAELDQVRTLQNREEEIHSEFVRHIANPAPSSQAQERFAQLREYRTANRAALDEMRTGFQDRLSERESELSGLLDQHLKAAIEAECAAVGATVCSVAHVRIWQPVDPEMSVLQPANIPVVHWGARDITDAVITRLDGVDISQEPPSGVTEVAQWPGLDLAESLGPDPFGKDGSEVMSHGTSLARSLPFVVAALATAAQAQNVALLDLYTVQERAAPYVSLKDDLSRFEAQKRDEYNVRSGFVYLPIEDASKAAALQIRQVRGETLAAEELAELDRLYSLNDGNEILFLDLIDRPGLTADEEQQLRSLAEMKRLNQDSIKELAQSLATEINQRELELYTSVRDVLDQAIEQACRAINATVCLQSVLIVWEPVDDEGGLQPVPLVLTHWGGTNITENVIELLGRSAAPATRGGS